MRRMYSVQELSKIVHDVMGEYIEDGAFDDAIEEYVDAYLEEHPVDPTAITGLDIAPKDVTASGNITAPSIIENMSGYSAQKKNQELANQVISYCGAVKNGNKLTLALASEITPTSTFISYGGAEILEWLLPAGILAKLYPFYGSSNYLAFIKGVAVDESNNRIDVTYRISKNPGGVIVVVLSSGLTAETKYYLRCEVTFLLSDSLITEE